MTEWILRYAKMTDKCPFSASTWMGCETRVYWNNIFLTRLACIFMILLRTVHCPNNWIIVNIRSEIVFLLLKWSFSIRWVIFASPWTLCSCWQFCMFSPNHWNSPNACCIALAIRLHRWHFWLEPNTATRLEHLMMDANDLSQLAYQWRNSQVEPYERHHKSIAFELKCRKTWSSNMVKSIRCEWKWQIMQPKQSKTGTGKKRKRFVWKSIR